MNTSGMAAMENRPPKETGSGLFCGYLVVAASFFIMVAMWAAYDVFDVFFKPMANELGCSKATTSGAFSLSSLMSGLLAIAMGRLTDMFGPRPVMSICALFMGILLMSGYLSDMTDRYQPALK